MSVMTKEEFAREVRGYTMHMYRLAYSILNNSTDAEDAVSEAVLHAYEKLRTLRDPDSFKNWILQITANEAKRFIGKISGPVRWHGKRICPRHFMTNAMNCGMLSCSWMVDTGM